MATEQTKLVKILATRILQVILALSLTWAACMKLFYPAEQLARMWPWTADHPLLTKITGVVDLIVGLGLVVPDLVRVRSKLTVYASYALVALMISASIFHIIRGEASQTGLNLFFLAAAAWIGRTKQKQPDK